MSLRIAVTRTAPEVHNSVARLNARGALAFAAPLLEIAARADIDRDIAGAQALLFTSANGVRAFGSAPIRALTVGDATAAAARNVGFANVEASHGDSQALAALAREKLRPQDGRVIHISGADVASDLVGALAAAGFDAERRIAYEARAATALPAALADALKNGTVDRVVFHSARAAQVFHSLAGAHAARLTAVTLSPMVASAAQVSPWARIIAASAPREDALIEAALAP